MPNLITVTGRVFVTVVNQINFLCRCVPQRCNNLFQFKPPQFLRCNSSLMSTSRSAITRSTAQIKLIPMTLRPYHSFGSLEINFSLRFLTSILSAITPPHLCKTFSLDILLNPHPPEPCSRVKEKTCRVQGH